MNHQSSLLIGRIAQYALALLGILFFILIYFDKAIGIDGGLWVTYIAFVLSAGMALIFAVIGLNKKMLIGIGAFVVLLGISYAMADGSVRPEWGITETTSKWIGAGIGLLAISMIGAIGAIVVGEVSRMFK